MVTPSALTEIKGELASIEQLISVLLQKQTDLVARLTSIEEPWLPSSTAGVAPKIPTNNHKIIMISKCKKKIYKSTDK